MKSSNIFSELHAPHIIILSNLQFLIIH